jgi:hypothetical protein
MQKSKRLEVTQHNHQRIVHIEGIPWFRINKILIKTQYWHSHLLQFKIRRSRCHLMSVKLYWIEKWDRLLKLRLTQMKLNSSETQQALCWGSLETSLQYFRRWTATMMMVITYRRMKLFISRMKVVVWVRTSQNSNYFIQF